MQFSARRRRSLWAVLLSAVLALATAAIPAGIANADNPQFGMSASLVHAGETVVVTQVDPCPVSAPDEYGWGRVQVNFTDSDGVAHLYSRGIDAQGDWDPIWVTPRARVAMNTDPVYYRPEAAQGVGTMTAQCIHEDAVIMEYAARTLTISGSSPEFSISSAMVDRTVRLESTDPCPQDTVSVEGYLSDLTDSTPVAFNTVPDTNGHWEVEFTIPSSFPAGPAAFRLVRCHPPAPHYNIHLQAYGDRVATIAPTTPYVALGDSYSSGTGTFDYYPGSGDCRRSEYGYPTYVADQLDLGVPLFVACHGAQTADFYYAASTNEPAQISHLSEHTQVVTLTFGGNDAGFSGVMEECVQSPLNPDGWSCSTNTSIITDLSERLEALAGNSSALAADGRPIYSLDNLYGDIATAAPNAQIYVSGYPRLFGGDAADYVANSNAPGGAHCVVTPGATVSYSDAQWLNQKANELNGVIEGAVDAAHIDGVDITFVPAALFSSHGLCDSSDPWINSVVMDGNPIPGFTPESLHPTSEGYQNGYGIAFVTIMS